MNASAEALFHAFSGPPVFSCNTTVPLDGIRGFRPEPSCGRGTASIIWNCLAVMIFAVWSTIHLNTRTLRSPLWYKTTTRRACALFWTPWRKLLGKKRNDYRSGTEFPGFTSRKALEAVTTILFPEAAVVVAVEECIAAHYIRYTTRKRHGWDKFTLSQAHLVAMGGVYLPALEIHEDFDQYVQSNNLQFDDFPLPADISRRAKKEWFDKILALFQGVWFLVNCISRYNHRYSLARLEFTAMNYLSYALVVFILRWRKPQELQDPFFLKKCDMDADLEFNMSVEQGQSSMDNESDSGFSAWYKRYRYIVFGLILLSLCITGSLSFGLRLPGVTHYTQSELWRMALAGIACIGLAPLPYVLYWGLKSQFWASYSIVLCGGYAALRLKWLVEAFLYFQKETPDVYYTAPSWTQYLGHVGS